MFQCAKRGGVFVVSGSTAINHESAGALVQAFDGCLERGQSQVVLSFDEVPLIDSVGLETLCELGDQCVRRGGSLVLSVPDLLCNEILQVTGVAQRFAIFDSLVTAIGSFSQ